MIRGVGALDERPEVPGEVTCSLGRPAVSTLGKALDLTFEGRNEPLYFEKKAADSAPNATPPSLFGFSSCVRTAGVP
jgi:hypothetical protein